MSLLLNVLWFVLGGFIVSLLYLWQERQLKAHNFGRFLRRLPPLETLHSSADGHVLGLALPGAQWSEEMRQTREAQLSGIAGRAFDGLASTST